MAQSEGVYERFRCSHCGHVWSVAVNPRDWKAAPPPKCTKCSGEETFGWTTKDGPKKSAYERYLDAPPFERDMVTDDEFPQGQDHMHY